MTERFQRIRLKGSELGRMAQLVVPTGTFVGKHMVAWLNKLDTEKLINTYLIENPISYDTHKEYLDHTVRGIRDKYKEILRQYIEGLSMFFELLEKLSEKLSATA